MERKKRGGLEKARHHEKEMSHERKRKRCYGGIMKKAEGGEVDVYGKNPIHAKGMVKDIDSLHEKKGMKKGGHARRVHKAEGGLMESSPAADMRRMEEKYLEDMIEKIMKRKSPTPPAIPSVGPSPVPSMMPRPGMPGMAAPMGPRPMMPGAMKKGGRATKKVHKAEGGTISKKNPLRPMDPLGTNPVREMGMVKNIDTLNERHAMKKGGRAHKKSHKACDGEMKIVHKAAGGAAKVRKGMMSPRGRVL